MSHDISDASWGFKYYLARSPESTTTAAGHAALPDIRQALFSSNEARQSYSKRVPSGEFCVWRRDLPRIGIVSNCQGPELARAIASLADVSVYGLEVMITRDTDPTPCFDLLDSCDVVLAAHMSDDWGMFSNTALRERYGARVCFYIPVYYNGLHPDITYVGSTSQRIPSPVGDYHSRILLSHYVGNRPVAEALKHFCAAGFRDMGYADAAKASEHEYRTRETRSQIRTADWFFENMAREPLLYSINHPTPRLTQKIATAFLEEVGIRPREIDARLTPSALSANIIWPIHDFWADALGLGYRSGELFHTSLYAMDLDEFAWRSYEIYRRVDFDVMKASAAARGILPA